MKTAPNSECRAVLMLALSCGFCVSGRTGITGEELSEKESIYCSMVIFHAVPEILCY